MVALLVGLSIMGVMMSVALPVWKTTSIREKEAELVFRGEQYMRAIELFGRRNGPGVLPPSIDVLVQQRYLRKKFKDPITNDDFQPLLAGQNPAGSLTPGQPLPPAGAGAGRSAGPAQIPPTPGRGGIGSTVGMAVGGIQGVVSKSKAKSFRLYNGRNYYNEWAFVYTPRAQAPGAEGPGGRGRGGNQPPQGPGGRGPGRGPGGGTSTFSPAGPGGRQPVFPSPQPQTPPVRR